MLVFGVVAAGILVAFVFLAVALGARASRQAKTIQARVGEHVTARSPSVFQHECSFLTKASAESVYDYFMDFPCHADWEQGSKR